MPYDFDQLIDRRPSNSYKWNKYPLDALPMWLADMDFASPRAVLEALRAKVEHGIFGYEQPSAEHLEVVCERMWRLYRWRVTPDQITPLPGLVRAMNAVCRAIGQPGDGVLTHTPIYPPFLSAPVRNQRALQTTPLTLVSDGPTFHYEIDFDAFEKAIAPSAKLYFLCNPHNPGGFVFSRDQLTRLAEICLRRNVIICADEIHSELILDGSAHIPLAAIAPEIASQTITLVAPSKTFNTAGLACGFVIAPNPKTRATILAATEDDIPWINSLGLAAALAAFRDDPDTDEWLASLRQYLKENRDTLVECLTTQLPDIQTTVPEATFLAWLDCRHAGIDGDPHTFFLEKAKVAFNDGKTFGPGGDGFVRLNFGCPRSRLLEALERMKEALA
ncbi:MAG: putative C-S lyase [Chloroflexi bacterium]|nr:putative C-S lyase [Chloroflexota bacterium]